ncbi:hypothetical protein GCM10010340_00310 [Streptomyces griseoloalbus]|nr:hypothetical protein GCM10010340_00310 [Streptomyces albaduncus]
MRQLPERGPVTGRPARDRPASAATRGPAGPVVPVRGGKASYSRPAAGTSPRGTARATDAPATTPVGPPADGPAPGTGTAGADGPAARTAPAPGTHTADTSLATDGTAAPPPARAIAVTGTDTAGADPAPDGPATRASVPGPALSGAGLPLPGASPDRGYPPARAPSGSARPRGDVRVGRGGGDGHGHGAGLAPVAAPGVPDRLGVDVLLRQRPRLAAVGLGLGVAAVSEPFLTPAGPAETSAAASMPPQRRQEFLAGRCAARRALRTVGLDCGEIPRAGRLPVFPPGRAASISHSAGVAVAVARAPGRDTPLGCDLELRPLPPGAVRLVLREDEEGLLNAGPWSVTALFSAKEAAWKALHGPDGTRAAGSSGSLRDLRARPSGEGLRIELRTGPARAVRVRVVPVGWGVFSYVTGWSAA